MRCKKWVFTLQKGGFYTPKTPFLFFVSITTTLLMGYEHSVKWLRTPTKLVAKQPPMAANGLAIIQYMCVIMWCLWDIKIGEAQNTFVFLHFSTTHFIRRYLGNCATIRRVACPKKVRCLCQIPPTCKLIAHVNRANAVHCTFCIYGALGVTGHYFVDGSYLECKRCSLILITCTGI